MSHSKLNYRADIDGLRAIAVLSVIFYHAGFGLFCGGYVGVDVFFVISGYLITTVIVQEIYDGRFSIARFYERRIRRIFPALFATLVFTLAVSAYLFDVEVFLAVGKSVIAAAIFLSNHLFWSEAGYFDAPSYLKPLLHTWSLAIEEQFYIFYPLLLLISYRLWKSIKPVLVATALLSFLASVYYVQQDPTTAFYFAPLRAWELMIGGMLAVNMIPSNIRPKYRNLLCILGIIMILACAVIYTNDTSFPGASALLPTLGAALIIYSGIDGEVGANRILGARPLAFIGQISYSLYLLHWPIIVFGKYYLIRNATTPVMLSWLGIAFLLSVLSWKFIETPFRSKTFMSQANIFRLAAASMIFVVLAGAAIYVKDGFPGRFDAQYEETPRVTWSRGRWGDCEMEFLRAPKIENLCALGGKADNVSFLVWGDSHAESLAPAINKSAKNQGVEGNIVFSYGCPPMLGTGLGKVQPQDKECFEHNARVLEYIKNRPSIKTIALVGMWALYAEDSHYTAHGAEQTTLADILFPKGTDSPNAALFSAGLTNMVEQLTGLNRNIVIVLQTPEVGYYVPTAYFTAMRTNRDINQIIAPTLEEYRDRNKNVMPTINALLQRGNVSVVDPARALCKEGVCLVMLDNQPLYEDDNHISLYASLYISYIFDPVFENIRNASVP